MFRIIINSTRFLKSRPLVYSIRSKADQCRTQEGQRNYNFKRIAVGIGCATAITGLVAISKYDFQKTVADTIPLGRIFTSWVSKSEADKKKQEQTEESDRSEVIESLIDEGEIEIDLEKLQELHAICDSSYFAAMTAYSLAAQAVRGLTADVEKFGRDHGNTSSTNTSADHALVLQLLERHKAVKGVVVKAAVAAKESRTHLEALQEAVTNFNVNEDNELEENSLAAIVKGLPELETQLTFAEDFLKQALDSSGPSLILKQYVENLTSDLQQELGFSGTGLNSEDARERFLKALDFQVQQQRTEVERAMQSLDGLTKELLLSAGENASEKRLQALIATKEAQLKHVLSEENFQHLRQLRRHLDSQLKEEVRAEMWKLNETKSRILKKKRLAFERELNEQYNVALAAIVHDHKELIDNIKQKMIPNLDEIELQIKASAEALSLATCSHKLIDALHTNPFPQLDWKHQIQPLSHIVESFYELSFVTSGSFVDTVLSTIPSKAMDRGVYTLNGLKNRFQDVERRCRKVSLLTDREHNSLFKYLMSYLRSLLLIRPVSVVSLSEKINKPAHQDRLHNEAILDRAKFFIEQGDLRQAVCYMNMLQGVAQFLSRDWIYETCLHMEVLQAAQVVSAFSGLLVHYNVAQNDATHDPKK